jgi:hypothetical protein
MLRHVSVLTALLILLTACTTSLTPSEQISSETETGCRPSKIQKSQNDFLEIQGEMQSEGEMWALLFFESAHTNQEEKIVWRITGESETFQAQAQNEEGTVIEPIWIEYHGGSNWQRPGQEWGTGLNFPTPGCWTISVSRGEIPGAISLDVLAP